MPGVVVFKNTVPSKDVVDGFSIYVIINISMSVREFNIVAVNLFVSEWLFSNTE